MIPSRAQMRMLHVLEHGKLVFQRLPTRRIELIGAKEKGEGVTDWSWQFHESTARVIVGRGWAELARFNPHRGEYRITIKGKALTKALCECIGRQGQRSKGIRQRAIDWHLPESTEEFAGKVLCVYCGRVVKDEH